MNRLRFAADNTKWIDQIVDIETRCIIEKFIVYSSIRYYI